MSNAASRWKNTWKSCIIHGNNFKIHEILSHLVGTIGIGKRLSADISVKRYVYHGKINCALYHVIMKNKTLMTYVTHGGWTLTKVKKKHQIWTRLWRDWCPNILMVVMNLYSQLLWKKSEVPSTTDIQSWYMFCQFRFWASTWKNWKHNLSFVPNLVHDNNIYNSS